MWFTGSVWFFHQNVFGVCFLSVPAFMLIEGLIFSFCFQEPDYLCSQFLSGCCSVVMADVVFSFPETLFTCVLVCEMFLHLLCEWQASCLFWFTGTFSEKSFLKPNPIYTIHTHPPPPTHMHPRTVASKNTIGIPV